MWHSDSLLLSALEKKRSRQYLREDWVFLSQKQKLPLSQTNQWLTAAMLGVVGGQMCLAKQDFPSTGKCFLTSFRHFLCGVWDHSGCFWPVLLHEGTGCNALQSIASLSLCAPASFPARYSPWLPCTFKTFPVLHGQESQARLSNKLSAAAGCALHARWLCWTQVPKVHSWVCEVCLVCKKGGRQLRTQELQGLILYHYY